MYYYPQVENPTTHEVANLYSDQVNTWLQEGVKEKDLASWPRVTPSVFNRNTVFTNDILYNIMLNSNVNTIKKLCQTDQKAYQICQHPQFWNNKIIHDGYYLHDTTPKTMRDYTGIDYWTHKINEVLSKSLRTQSGVYILGYGNRPNDISYQNVMKILPADIMKQLDAKENDFFRMAIRNYQELVIVKHPDVTKYIFKLSKHDILNIALKAKYYGVWGFNF